MPSRPELYTPNGLNWDLIRNEFMEKASPEEREAQEASYRRPMGERIAKPVKPQSERAKPPNALSSDVIEQIINYYKVGQKVTWIGKEVGVSDATVRKHLVNAGVYDATRDRSRKKG